MKKRVLIPIAHGNDEMEIVVISDLLYQAGAEVVFASVEDTLQVTAARQAKIVADNKIEHYANDTFDLIFCPGGMVGSEHFRDSPVLMDLLKKQQQSGRLFSAICAAPAVVFAPHGLLNNYEATCYPIPALVQALPNKKWVHRAVVVDRNCVTSQGPGTAMLLAIKLIELLFNKETAIQVAKRALIDFSREQL